MMPQPLTAFLIFLPAAVTMESWLLWRFANSVAIFSLESAIANWLQAGALAAIIACSIWNLAKGKNWRAPVALAVVLLIAGIAWLSANMHIRDGIAYSRETGQTVLLRQAGDWILTAENGERHWRKPGPESLRAENGHLILKTGPQSGQDK